MTEKPRKRSAFPKTLSQCIEPLIRPVLKTQGLAGTRLLTDWNNIVGTAMARRCVPQKLSFPAGKTTDGTLTVTVENGFATELQHMQPVIIEKLATYFGYKAVSRIVISHSFSAPAETPRAAPAPKRVAIDAHVADAVTDSELKEALQSFADSMSGRKDKP